MRSAIMMLLLFCQIAVARTQGIAFEHSDFAAVCARAREERKLIFIDFYTSWCGPCKHMAETVFKEERVGQFFNSRFVSYKVDAEKGEGKSLAAKYLVAIFPTYLFLDDKGAIFDKAIGACTDTVFLGIAGKAQQSYSDPYSLPRLKSQYPLKKDDTAFLRRYLDKLDAARMPACDVMEQYLAIQTAMPAGSREMLTFLLAHPADLTYGGQVERILEEGALWKVADSAQLKKLDLAQRFMLPNTRDYAVAAKSETLLNVFIAACGKLPPADRVLYLKEKTWLDYYVSTENWGRYRPLADRWLDSICLCLRPIPADTIHKRPLFSQTPEEVLMRRTAGLVSDQARIYYSRFFSEPQVLEKAMRWMQCALSVLPDNPYGLTFYANLLYRNGDTARAILTKQKALNDFPPGSLHRNIVQTNLAHMQHGEALEEE